MVEIALEKEVEPRHKTCVIGGTGLMGKRYCEFLGPENVIAPAHQTLDLLFPEIEVSRQLKKLKLEGVSCISNFAAITNVDFCEKERGNKNGIVWQTNVEGALKLARACTILDIPFLYVSSDYVLSGETWPHKEDEAINPVNSYYAQSKAEAEFQLIEMIKRGAKIHIVRIQRPFTDDLTVKKGDLLRDAYFTIRAGRPFLGIIDQNFTPLYVGDAARAINLIACFGEYGIWHVSTPTVTTPYEFVKLGLVELEKLGVVIEWHRLREANFYFFQGAIWEAPRPRHTAFDISKFESRFGKGVLRPLPEMLGEWAKHFTQNLKNAQI